jgi:predicted double-glycine peptidase
VLDYLGFRHEEAELAQACGSLPAWGTLPSDAINGLEKLGYRALWFENASFDWLLSLLEQDWPVIVFLMAANLSHGKTGLHAVVLSEFQGDQAVFMDPSLGTEIQMVVGDFLRAWSALDNQGIVIWKA